MTSDRRLLVALAATLAPGQAARLLERLGDPGSEPLRAEVIRLASAPRAVRLTALGLALAALHEPAGERRRLVVRPSGRTARPPAPRTGVCAADGRAPRQDTAPRRISPDPGRSPARQAALPLARRVERSRA